MLVSLVFRCIQEKRNNVGTLSVQFYMATVLPVLGSAVLSHIIMCTGKPDKSVSWMIQKVLFNSFFFF